MTTTAPIGVEAAVERTPKGAESRSSSVHRGIASRLVNEVSLLDSPVVRRLLATGNTIGVVEVDGDPVWTLAEETGADEIYRKVWDV